MESTYVKNNRILECINFLDRTIPSNSIHRSELISLNARAYEIMQHQRMGTIRIDDVALNQLRFSLVKLIEHIGKVEGKYIEVIANNEVQNNVGLKKGQSTTRKGEKTSSQNQVVNSLIGILLIIVVGLLGIILLGEANVSKSSNEDTDTVPINSGDISSFGSTNPIDDITTWDMSSKTDVWALFLPGGYDNID
ncbi:MAG: hypothetical protein AAGI23_13445 [Bacteroidota bacterium]